VNGGKQSLRDGIRNFCSFSGTNGFNIAALWQMPRADQLLEGKLLGNIQEKIHPNGHTLLMTFSGTYQQLAQRPGPLVAMTFLAESIHFW
jgi:hypothetical protein